MYRQFGGEGRRKIFYEFPNIFEGVEVLILMVVGYEVGQLGSADFGKAVLTLLYAHDAGRGGGCVEFFQPGLNVSIC